MSPRAIPAELRDLLDRRVLDAALVEQGPGRGDQLALAGLAQRLADFAFGLGFDRERDLDFALDPDIGCMLRERPGIENAMLTLVLRTA